MNERKTLTATDGKILTNGEIFGRTIILAEDLKESDFYEITEEEYESLQFGEEAEVEDYKEALGKLGVK